MNLYLNFAIYAMPLAIPGFSVPKLHPISKMGVVLRLTMQAKRESLLDWVPTYSNMCRSQSRIRKNRVNHEQFSFLL
jgi:hypothetical protein